MNWYKKAKFNALIIASAQEWWIGPNGSVIEADTDSNGGEATYGHEDRAIEEAQRIVKEAISEHPVFSDLVSVFGEMGNYEEYDPIASREYLNNWIDEAYSMGSITENQVDDIYGAISEATGLDREILDIAMGNAEDYAARDYALQHWKWIAVRGKNIEIFSLSPSDVEQLSEGLFEIYGSRVKDIYFDIHLKLGNKYLTNVPYQDIKNGNLAIHMRGNSALKYI